MKNNTNICIKPASIEDAPLIVAWQMKMALETENLVLDQNKVTNGVNAVFRNPEKGFYLIAILGETRCGSLMITPEWSDWRNAWVWWIQSVYVLPEFRKTGVFNAMYSYIRHKVSERDDVSGIRLYVDISNHSAQEVYSRIGMNGGHYRTFEWMK